MIFLYLAHTLDQTLSYLVMRQTFVAFSVCVSRPLSNSYYKLAMHENNNCSGLSETLTPTIYVRTLRDMFRGMYVCAHTQITHI